MPITFTNFNRLLRLEWNEMRYGAADRFKLAKKTMYKLIALSFIILVLHLTVLIWQTPWLINMDNIQTLELQNNKTITKTEMGTLIANYEEYNIDYIMLQDVPVELIEVFLAIEDSRYFQHYGVDMWGISRALWTTFSGSQIQGGSTISQQLARNLFLTNERTMKRKLDELVIAIQLERHFSKEEILEMYLNQIHFGKQYYGIARAAKGYFEKNLNELTLGEIAILAGMPKGPNLFYPAEENMDRALGRQKVVLNRLVNLKLIDEEEALAAYDYLFSLLNSQGGQQ